MERQDPDHTIVDTLNTTVRSSVKHWIDRERDKVVKPFPTIDWRSTRKGSDDENSDRSWSNGSVQPVDRSLDRYSPCDNRRTLPRSDAIESLESIEPRYPSFSISRVQPVISMACHCWSLVRLAVYRWWRTSPSRWLSFVIQSGAGCSLLRERERSSLLFTIDRTEVALFPLREAKFIEKFSRAIIIPDFDILLVEPFGVCFAPDYPQEFFDNTSPEDTFRRQ